MAIFDITYVGDMPYLKLEGGTVTGATIFNSSITANSGSITNNLAVGSINGVTVGSNPKFTDTTYSVATTSANGLLPALGGGTTNYLRADGAWAKPPGTTYSVATTSANGLMAAADKVAVNKIGSGTLNTTSQTIIPAINELVTKVGISSITTEEVSAGSSSVTKTLTADTNRFVYITPKYSATSTSISKVSSLATMPDVYWTTMNAFIFQSAGTSEYIKLAGGTPSHLYDYYITYINLA